MNIVVITSLFPYKTINDWVFVENLVKSLADRGEKVTVIAPFSLTKAILRHRPMASYHEKRRTEKGYEYEVYWPKYVSFGNIQKLEKFTHRIAKHVTLRTIEKLPNPDVILAKFYGGGTLVYEYAKLHKIPLVIDNGESEIPDMTILSNSQRQEYVATISGVISNSTKCKEEGMSLGLTVAEKNIVIPNGINPAKFHRENKLEMRKQLGINENDFIVAFVGWFSDRKGSLRLSSAIESLNNEKIKSIFIGEEMEPDTMPCCTGILYCGTLLNNMIYKYLSASDVFVLPTLAEGCCNAIIEAMACGLPIISSDRSFNNDILDDNYSFRVDPESVPAIAEKIDWMYHHREECAMMGQKAWEASQSMTLENRASKIMDFLQAIVGKSH